MIVPFEGALNLGVSSEDKEFTTTLSMILHSVNKPGSQSFAVCPRKKGESLTLYFNAFTNNLALGTKYWFHVTTRGILNLGSSWYDSIIVLTLFTGKHLHKLKPLSNVYRQTFGNSAGPIARLQAKDGTLYYCNGHYVSFNGQDCNYFTNLPPLESPLAMYPWPYQQLYLFKSIGTNLG